MRVFDATSRFIYEDIRFMYGTMAILYITLPLAIFWFTLGILFNMDAVHTVIYGPMYGLIISYGVAGYITSLPVAVGLGSTRKQYLKNYFLLGITSILVIMVILNLVEYVLVSLNINEIISVSFMDTGKLFFNEYNFFSYVAVDFSLGLFIFGVTALITSIFYRLGFLKTAILFVTIILIVTLFLQLGTLEGFIDWIFGLRKSVLLSLPAIVGAVALFSTYPIMIHAPLKSSPVGT